MRKKNAMHYLNHRYTLLAVLQLVIALMLIAGVIFLHESSGVDRLLFVSIVIALYIMLAIAFYFFVVRPYRRTEHMINMFLEGYTLSGLDASHVSISPLMDRMISSAKAELDASHLLKLSKRQAQFRALQNQINPHFLYNTLESIRSEALVAGLDSVAEMTEALAVFFRYTISKVENLVTVEEELQNCNTYFRIQQYRFGPRLSLDIQCDPEEKEAIYRCRIPKLTMQPILENSIIHGTEFKIGAGKLTVKLERTEDRLVIIVSDDGIGMDEETLTRLNERLGKSGLGLQAEKEESKGGVALVNVNTRIHLLFGEEYGLHVFSMPDIGTDVQIVLPMITSDRMVIGSGVL